MEDHETLQQDLDKIHFWTICNNLPLNASKCAVVHFSSSRKHSLFDYNLGGVPMVVSTFKLLGVILSSSLSVTSHVDKVCKKVSRLTGFVIRISRHMHYSALLHLFKALILPHLTYCAVVWNPCQVGFLQRLDKSQRKISKVLMYRKRCPSDLSYEQRLVEFGLLQTNDLFTFLRLVFCFKLIIGLGPCMFLQFFSLSKVSESRYLHITARTNAFFNSVFVSFPRLWNQLPISVRSSTTLNSFKSLCKDHLLS